MFIFNGHELKARHADSCRILLTSVCCSLKQKRNGAISDAKASIRVFIFTGMHKK